MKNWRGQEKLKIIVSIIPYLIAYCVKAIINRFGKRISFIKAIIGFIFCNCKNKINFIINWLIAKNGYSSNIIKILGLQYLSSTARRYY